MTATGGNPPSEEGAAAAGAQTITAGRVGRAHGLDGSFYVTGARPRLLMHGTEITLAGRTATVVRRAGTDARPILRLEGIEDRSGAEAVRGMELTVGSASMPPLEEGEWWASELEGCEVFDGERHVGTVIRLVELPSCEALQVRRHISAATNTSGVTDELLIPMVRDAIRDVDATRQRIDVDMSFIE